MEREIITLGTEECNLIAIKGTETAGTAADPEYSSGSILDGDEQVDFPLYRIPISGLSVGSPVQLFTVIDSYCNHVASRLILTEGSDYGTSLPAAGNKGRLFFKKVSD